MREIIWRDSGLRNCRFEFPLVLQRRGEIFNANSNEREQEREKIKLQIVVCGRWCVKGSSVKATIDWECHKRYFEPHSAFPACWNRKSDFEGSHLRQKSQKYDLFRNNRNRRSNIFLCQDYETLQCVDEKASSHTNIYCSSIEGHPKNRESHQKSFLLSSLRARNAYGLWLNACVPCWEP